MNITPAHNLRKVKFQRTYPGYIYRREIIDDSDYGGNGNLEMVRCYSADTGHYMGNSKMARHLCKKRGIRQIQKAKPEHTVCSIGFNESEQKWYGWSHRAICGFGIGNRLFEEEYGDDNTPFILHGKHMIINLEEAKQSAVRFAESVS